MIEKYWTEPLGLLGDYRRHFVYVIGAPEGKEKECD